MSDIPALTWIERVNNLFKTLGRKPTFDELIDEARKHTMTPEEIEEQRKSWARANVATGDPRWD